jgi:hypothetical protein
MAEIRQVDDAWGSRPIAYARGPVLGRYLDDSLTVDSCVNCLNPADTHIDGKCLFDATLYRKHTPTELAAEKKARYSAFLDACPT